MKLKRHPSFITIIFLVVVALLATIPIQAQQTPLLAYVNAGGQLVISGTDANFRWIVTNPGEPIVANTNLVWSPDGSRLFYAVQGTDSVSLRVASPGNQTSTELTAIGGAVMGGEWMPNGQGIIIGANNGLNLIAINNGDVTLIAPNARLTSGQTISPDGRSLFYHADGQFTLQSNTSAVALPGTNNASAAGIGIWSDVEAWVAFWVQTAQGTSALNVTSANSGETLTIDTGSTVPVTPLQWIPDSTILIYRSARGIGAVDVSCLTAGCNQIPQTVFFLPVNVGGMAISNNTLIYMLGGSVRVASTDCITNGNCENSASQIEAATANSPMKVAGRLAAYTAGDGTLHLLDLACVDSGNCTPIATGVTGSINTIAPDGQNLLVTSSGQLQILNLRSASLSPLTQISGSIRAAWN